MSGSPQEPYDPSSWLGQECLVCYAPAPTHGLPVGYEDGTMDGVMLWCDSCWEAREARSVAYAAATREVARHGYVLTTRCRRLLVDLITDGHLSDASPTTLRRRGSRWFLGWNGVGKVTAAEIERLTS